MEEQSSICLQKMMIIMLSVILFGLLFTFSFLKKDELIAKAEVISPNNVFIYNAKMASKKKSLTKKLDEVRKFRESLITVNEINDDENDIISIEQIAYAAVTNIEITDDEIIDNSMNEIKPKDTNDDLVKNENLEDTKDAQDAKNAEKKEELNGPKVDENIIKDVNSRDEEKIEDIQKAQDVQESQDIQKEQESQENQYEQKGQESQGVQANQQELEASNTNYVSYKSLAENNPPTEYKSVYEVSATAYCLCKKCCGKSPSSPNYGMTASGLRIVPGTGVKAIAVDTSVIPLGSKVYVEGLNGAWDYGYATAADTGSAIKNNKIDLYMDTHSECLSWGRKTVKVYVVE